MPIAIFGLRPDRRFFAGLLTALADLHFSAGANPAQDLAPTISFRTVPITLVASEI